MRVQLGLIRLPSVGFSLGQFCVNHLPIFPQETLPGLNGSSPFIQARPCLENPRRWLCERRVLLDPARTSGGLMATTCGPRGGARPLRTNSSGVEKESECSPENLFVSFGAVWKLFIELRAGGEDKEGCITWGQDYFRPIRFHVRGNALGRAWSLCRPNVPGFILPVCFFLSVEPIIIANGSITAFVSGVLFCCTLSADFFNALQLANYAILWCNNWPVDSLTLFFFFASVCKGAKADVVFLIDGSWSIGEESFTKVVHFVSDMIGAFDVIGPSGMQVCAENTDSYSLWQGGVVHPVQFCVIYTTVTSQWFI